MVLDMEHLSASLQQLHTSSSLNSKAMLHSNACTVSQLDNTIHRAESGGSASSTSGTSTPLGSDAHSPDFSHSAESGGSSSGSSTPTTTSCSAVASITRMAKIFPVESAQQVEPLLADNPNRFCLFPIQ